MLKQKLVDITPGLAVLVLLHIWLMNARDRITQAETGLLSMGELRQSWCQAGEQEDMSQSILIETVRVVRDFLNAELAKYDSWDNLQKGITIGMIERIKGGAKELMEPLASAITSNDFIRGLFDVRRAFETTKGSGVGQTTILKFLGGGWKQWKIQSALDTLNAEDINMDAITTDGISLDLKWIILKS